MKRAAHPGDERALEWTLNGVEVYNMHGTEARSQSGGLRSTASRFEQLGPRLVCNRCKQKATRLTVLPPVYPR